MRVSDKILVEEGSITKAKVKWYGGGFAYPYLWKEKKTDTEHNESWGDPRIVKTKKEKVKKQVVIPKMKKGKSPRIK